MNKSQQLTDEGFTEATEPDALFDDEATVLAQPVVPLAASAADAREEMTVVAGTPGPSGGLAAGLLTAARRPTLLALVLVSALAGAVLGGAALYLFQRSRTAPAETPAQTTAPAQPQAAGETTTATTAPVENQQPAAQNSEQPAPPATQDAQQPAPPAAETRPAAVQEQRPEAEQPREHEADDARTDSRRREGRRGRGGDDDDDEERGALLEQAAERRRRGDGAIDTQAPIPDDASPASRRAARVEEALRRIEDNRRARRARRVGVIH